MINIYTIYDNAVSSFSPPLHASSDEEAKHILHHIALDESTTICQNPIDFSLHCSGEFCADTGTITACTPRLVLSGTQLLTLTTKSEESTDEK